MAEDTNDAATVTQLAEYVNADTTGESAYLASCAAEAAAMVSQHIGAAAVPKPIEARAVLEVAADLYYRRRTRNGVADFADMEGAAPIRVARDPMTAAYPLLRPYTGLGIGMTFNMIEAARDLLNELAEHAALGGLPDSAALFTLDLTKAANALDAGRAIVTVGPPDGELPTGHAVDLTWTVIVAAGPHHDYLRGWAALDKVAGALISPPTDVETVRAISWEPAPNTRAYPAYQLTITTAQDI